MLLLFFSLKNKKIKLFSMFFPLLFSSSSVHSFGISIMKTGTYRVYAQVFNSRIYNDSLLFRNDGHWFIYYYILMYLWIFDLLQFVCLVCDRCCLSDIQLVNAFINTNDKIPCQLNKQNFLSNFVASWAIYGY